MGNRANFVLVKDQDWQLYYSHWAGCRILDALIGGPDLALRYAQSLRRCAKDEWVDPLWADGGAVVDLDHRRVLFFGDELMVEMAERRAMMSALRAAWPGYGIGCAYDGTAELAGYVGAELPPYRINGRSFSSPTIETHCVILFLLSTTLANCGCGRCGGTSARRGMGRRCWIGCPAVVFDA